MLLVVFFEGEDGEAGGVAVALCFERRVVVALPGAEVGEAPASVGLLLGEDCFD